MAKLSDDKVAEVRAAGLGDVIVINSKFAVMFVEVSEAEEMGFSCRGGECIYIESAGPRGKVANGGNGLSTLDAAKTHFLNFVSLR